MFMGRSKDLFAQQMASFLHIKKHPGLLGESSKKTAYQMQGATKFIPKITSTNQPVFLLGRLTCCLKARFKVDNYKLELAKAAIFTGRS